MTEKENEVIRDVVKNISKRVERDNFHSQEDDYSPTWGVFLGRMQPIHVGHIEIIKKMLAENDYALVLIGSANKSNQIRNPFTFTFRRMLLRQCFSQDEINRMKIVGLPDWSTEKNTNDLHQWGDYLYYNIVGNIGRKSFKMYYSDDQSIINSWFSEDKRKKITIVSIDREKQQEGISATKIRQALMNDDIDFLKKFLHPRLFENQTIERMKAVLLHIKEHPKDDFEMGD